MEVLIKTCPVCNKTKAHTEFNKQSKCKDGLQYHCRECQAESKWLYRYGITREEYFALLESQNFKCAICHTHIDDIQHAKFKTLIVDHDHASGKIRGLLCNACNVLLGQAFDNTEILLSAVEYLKRVKI